MPTDIEIAYAALSSKAATYNLLWRYYDGDHPLVYNAERLREVFDRIDARFVQNWCAVVVDAAMDRINLARWQVGKDQAATDLLNTEFARTQLNLDSDDAHLAALVCGEAFVIVWPNEQGEPEAYYNDPRSCYVQYDADNPRQMSWAAKWWVPDDGTLRLTIYHADRLEYWATTKKADQVSNADAFQPAETPTAANPYGQIPVFHLRRERRKTQSELANAMAPQDAVNKLLADMMVAAEFGAFRQRYAIANADLTALKNAPNEIWFLPASDGTGQPTQVGEFAQTDLGVYLTAIDKLATSIAIITRTPKHYFYQQTGDPSGEALIAMEAPLNRKVTRYIERFSATWQRVAAFILQLRGMAVDPADITPIFDRPETVQPRTEAEIRNLGVQAGIPLPILLKREGWSDQEIAELQAEKDAEQERSNSSLAASLVAAQRQFDQNQQAQGQDQEQQQNEVSNNG